jgi:hypothetical protein
MTPIAKKLEDYSNTELRNERFVLIGDLMNV